MLPYKNLNQNLRLGCGPGHRDPYAGTRVQAYARMGNPYRAWLEQHKQLLLPNTLAKQVS